MVDSFVQELVVTCIDTGVSIVNKQPPIATGTPLYAEIKRVTDPVIGISSQYMQVRAPKKQYCANVCLKINVKLGGMNSHLAPSMMMTVLTAKPTILLGADYGFKQPEQSIADLGTMTADLHKTFYQTCGCKPERIIVYRDAENEIAAVKAGCQSLEANYRTFAIVQRRHHTRFFPARPQDGVRNGNCKPGLVVDMDIVHPIEFDLYLQSHAGLLGTSRLTNYVVLLDELQDFTYKLCHLQARCTQSVSVVPAFYAHIVAARARLHSRNEHWTNTGSTETGCGDASSYSAVRPELG
ncbi:ribonuclease H-like domain-containing protein [Mortierella sp. GBAus27b]|nr:ribonuclease H-like domain-containing protein [Mortierella sp. GBAus27b]